MNLKVISFKIKELLFQAVVLGSQNEKIQYHPGRFQQVTKISIVSRNDYKNTYKFVKDTLNNKSMFFQHEKIYQYFFNMLKVDAILTVFHSGLIFTFCMLESTPFPLIPLISVDDFNALKIIFLQIIITLY